MSGSSLLCLKQVCRYIFVDSFMSLYVLAWCHLYLWEWIAVFPLFSTGKLLYLAWEYVKGQWFSFDESASWPLLPRIDVVGDGIKYMWKLRWQIQGLLTIFHLVASSGSQAMCKGSLFLSYASKLVLYIKLIQYFEINQSSNLWCSIGLLQMWWCTCVLWTSPLSIILRKLHGEAMQMVITLSSRNWQNLANVL